MEESGEASIGPFRIGPSTLLGRGAALRVLLLSSLRRLLARGRAARVAALLPVPVLHLRNNHGVLLLAVLLALLLRKLAGARSSVALARRRAVCKSAMRYAGTYEEWVRAAKVLDRLSGQVNEADLYDEELIRSRLEELRRRRGSLRDVVFCMRGDLVRNMGNMCNPELHKGRLQLKAPVIVVGCKLDLRDDQQNSLEQTMAPIMQSFREIETCIECSALRQIQVPEVFYYAQKAVLHPTAPLFDQEAQSLKPRCVRALKRIFILCDHDRDGALSDVELNDFQVRCFSAPLQPTEISGVKRVVQEKMPEGVNDSGLTLTGFLFLHALFIEKGRLETTWTVLRKFGYDNEIKLRDDFIPTSIKRAPDQTLELTTEVVDYLKGIFHMFDIDNDGALLPSELDDLFSTAPENPWTSDLYKDCADRNVLGGLSLEGFLSKWALMTLLDPANSFANLVYVGYSGDFSSAFTTTRKRRVDRKKQQTQRNVFQCYVFGPKGAGKTALLQSFLGRQPSDALPTNSDRFAANTVELSDGTRKTLVLREIPEGDVRSLLNNKESLAPCDAAVFVYDSCDEFSWQRARDLLVQVATHGENTGYEVPCLIVAAKDDLDQSPVALQESTRVSQDMGIETPIPISVKLKDLNNIFCRVVHAAQRPHLSIPETEAGKSRRQYRQLLNRSLMVVSVGAAIGVVGVAAFRIYAARKNSSS